VNELHAHFSRMTADELRIARLIVSALSLALGDRIGEIEEQEEAAHEEAEQRAIEIERSIWQ
jgi:hypothetical protein